jgi:hypothetical protein
VTRNDHILSKIRIIPSWKHDNERTKSRKFHFASDRWRFFRGRWMTCNIGRKGISFFPKICMGIIRHRGKSRWPIRRFENLRSSIAGPNDSEVNHHAAVFRSFFRSVPKQRSGDPSLTKLPPGSHYPVRTEGCPEHLAKRQHSRSRDNALFCNYINHCLVNPLYQETSNTRLRLNQSSSSLHFILQPLALSLFWWSRLLDSHPDGTLVIVRSPNIYFGSTSRTTKNRTRFCAKEDSMVLYGNPTLITLKLSSMDLPRPRNAKCLLASVQFLGVVQWLESW